ncbi:MAG: hypothetical protein ACR2PS_16110 [Pseudomonadales bacterium]
MFRCYANAVVTARLLLLFLLLFCKLAVAAGGGAEFRAEKWPSVQYKTEKLAAALALLYTVEMDNSTGMPIKVQLRFSSAVPSQQVAIALHADGAVHLASDQRKLEFTLNQGQEKSFLLPVTLTERAGGYVYLQATVRDELHTSMKHFAIPLRAQNYEKRHGNVELKIDANSAAEKYVELPAEEQVFQ